MSALLTQTLKVVSGLSPVTTNGAKNARYISLKNARRVIVVAEMKQDAGHETTMSITLRPLVASGSTATMTATMPVWRNVNVDDGDGLTRLTDAANVSCNDQTDDQILVMEIIPARLPADYTALRAALESSSQAGNFASITYLIETFYPQETPPTVVTD